MSERRDKTDIVSNQTDRTLDAIDRQLIAMLREDARLPVTSLAHAVSLSRASIHSRLARLKRDGIIAAYTLRLGAEFGQRLIRAHVMLKVTPKLARAVERDLAGMIELVALHAISGEYDMIAVVEAENVAALNDVIDRIGECEGVADTTSAILLSTKVQRGV